MSIQIIGLLHFHAAFTVYAIVSLMSMDSKSRLGDAGRAMAIVALCLALLTAMGASYEAGH